MIHQAILLTGYNHGDLISSTNVAITTFTRVLTRDTTLMDGENGDFSENEKKCEVIMKKR